MYITAWAHRRPEHRERAENMGGASNWELRGPRMGRGRHRRAACGCSASGEAGANGVQRHAVSPAALGEKRAASTLDATCSSIIRGGFTPDWFLGVGPAAVRRRGGRVFRFEMGAISKQICSRGAGGGRCGISSSSHTWWLGRYRGSWPRAGHSTGVLPAPGGWPGTRCC